MLFLPEDIRKELPALDKPGADTLARVKLFTPGSNWAWYLSGLHDEDTFFGLVVGLEFELTYFSLSEPTRGCGPLGLPVERDPYFKPKTFRELEAYYAPRGLKL